jgi:hypothetical protein
MSYHQLPADTQSYLMDHDLLDALEDALNSEYSDDCYA